jgi:hypothetical protein
MGDDKLPMNACGPRVHDGLATLPANLPPSRIGNSLKMDNELTASSAEAQIHRLRFVDSQNN